MKPNNWVSSSQASELLAKQRVTWPLAGQNYRALETVRTKSFDLDGFTIRAQFNPARAISTGARLDTQSLRERKCFLCPDNLPIEQERLPFGLRYLVLCNPYPIFPEHFTIPSREHAPQRILPRVDDFLELTRRLDRFTLFYNGPRSGASAPDHAHFQAVTRGLMPMDTEILSLTDPAHIGQAEAGASPNRSRTHVPTGCVSVPLSATCASPHRLRTRLPTEGETASPSVGSPYGGRIFLLKGYLRNGFVIQARDQAAAAELFREIYEALPIPEGEEEPMMNLFGMYSEERWTLTLIPRRRHRPWQYEAAGHDHLLSSPGAADIGGLFITPLEKDFEKLTPALLRDVYQQVCLSDQEVADIFVHLSSK